MPDEPRSKYFGRQGPAPEGTPPGGDGGAKPKTMLTQQMGPLPVWGWGVVAIAAAYLWMKIAGKGAAEEDPTKSALYPAGQGVGGVFLLPGGGGVSQPPGTTPPGTTPPGSHSGLSPDLLRMIGHGIVVTENLLGMSRGEQLTPEGQSFLHSVSGSANPTQTENFIHQNVARKYLGQPYIVGSGPWGEAGVMNPATGNVDPLIKGVHY